MTNLFQFKSYVEFLKELLRLHGQERGYQAKLAKAAGCQASYLSQVLAEKADLTSDQALNLATYLAMDEIEVTYFLTLLLRQRAVTPVARKHFDKQLEKQRREQKKLKTRVGNDESHPNELVSFYHSSWLVAAIHVSTSLSQQTTESLSEYLRVPMVEVKRILKVLESFGLVESKQNYWIYKGGAAHLPDSSYMTEVNHLNWRQKSVANLALNNDDDLRYTSVFTISEKDAAELRSDIMKAIGQWRTRISASPSEKTMAILCDIFEV